MDYLKKILINKIATLFKKVQRFNDFFPHL